MEQLKSILLAEDNKMDIELTLEGLARYNLANEVMVVKDGVEALDYLRCRGKFHGRSVGNPAVILLDIKMPKMGGLEVLKEIRSDPALRAIPVVVLTSSKEEADLVASYSLGANAYVVKPLEFREFIRAVSQLGAFWALLNEPPPNTAKRLR